MHHKVICAVRGEVDDVAPPVDDLAAYAVYRPHPDMEPEHPADVGAVAMCWFDAETLPDPRALDPSAWFDAPVEAYLVDERVQIEWSDEAPVGVAGDAIVQIPFVRRLPELTRAAFAAHWSDRHTPLVPVHHPGVARYVQNVVVDVLTPDAPDFDGVAQLYFPTAADFHDRYYDSDEGRRIVFDDVARFLDRGNGWRMLARETRLAT